MVVKESQAAFQPTTTSLDWSEAFRFADDLLVLTNSDMATQVAVEAASEYLAPRGLKLNLEKTT